VATQLAVPEFSFGALFQLFPVKSWLYVVAGTNKTIPLGIPYYAVTAAANGNSGKTSK
jgi:hypothetical protein